MNFHRVDDYTLATVNYFLLALASSRVHFDHFLLNLHKTSTPRLEKKEEFPESFIGGMIVAVFSEELPLGDRERILSEVERE